MLQNGPLFYRLEPHQVIQNLPGIGQKLARRIVEDLGDGDPHVALGSIERNPYSLTDVDGIGFKKADRIASQSFDVGAEDIRRHEAGNRHILELKGVLTAREMTGERAKLELRDPAHLEVGAALEDGLYWLPEELEAERGLEAWIRSLPKPGEDVRLADLTPAQTALLAEMGADEQQTRAIRAILGNPVLCFTGGAGTGKTFCTAGAAKCALLQGWDVRGMAFAGKAADRMREQFARYEVRAEASTIHKALGFQKKVFTVKLLGEKIIVIDESSMLPNWLLWEVVKALDFGAHLVLVGDPNQLPPIGHGTPFVDLLTAGVAHVHLEKNYRQQDQQGILRMAEGVLNRARPAPAECVEMHLGTEPASVDALFTELVQRLGGQDFEHWQGITYTNENAERYNLLAQRIVNPLGDPLFEYALWKLGTDPRNRPLHHAEIRTGDKILVVKNSTLLDIFNGQTGRVIGQVWKAKQVRRRDPSGGWEIVDGERMQHLRVDINTRMVDIPEDECEKYVQLGYVITVHKAQGSDWDRVIVMQPGKVRDDTARRFFYTAITRAKTQLAILSSLRTVSWWTNASADAAEEPSSLTKRLARPALEEAIGAGNFFRSEVRPEFQAAADAISGRHLTAEPAPQIDPWDTDPLPWPSYESDIRPHEQAAALELGMAEPLLISERDELTRVSLRQQWQTLDLLGVSA